MEEKKIIERPLMNEEEFKNYLSNNRNNVIDNSDTRILYLKSFDCVNKFKSVRRAIKKGLISPDGIIYPKRPFNNAKQHPNSINNLKKRIYGQLKQGKTI